MQRGFRSSFLNFRCPIQAGGAHFFAEEGEELSEEDRRKLETQSKERKRGHVGVRVTYTIHADGRLQSRWEIDATNALPALLQPTLVK